MRHHLGSLEDEVPDTGDLRQDVLCVLRRLRNNFREIGPEIAHGLMAEKSDVPADVNEVAPRAITAILARAAERGEVRPGRISPRITRLPADLLRHEVMLQHGDASDSFLAEILDEVFLPLVAAPDQPPGAGSTAAGRLSRAASRRAT